MGIRKTRTTPYHPESDGMVERFMRTLKDMVAKYIDSIGLHWDENVNAYAMAYNSSVHATTGHTPFFIIHGFEQRLPLDVMYGPPKELASVKSNLVDRVEAIRDAYRRVRTGTIRAAEEAVERYDRKTRDERYHIDKVWVRDHRAAIGGKPSKECRIRVPRQSSGRWGPTAER